MGAKLAAGIGTAIPRQKIAAARPDVPRREVLSGNRRAPRNESLFKRMLG
jgi:hypothetical protein